MDYFTVTFFMKKKVSSFSVLSNYDRLRVIFFTVSFKKSVFLMVFLDFKPGCISLVLETRIDFTSVFIWKDQN